MSRGPVRIDRGRGGFTMVEMIVVVAIVSILARIALPNLQEAAIKARAAAALGDVEVIRTAAANYHARTNQWPADAAEGVVPPELVQDLPEGFSFDHGEYKLDWEVWSLPDGLPSSGAHTLIGVSIATDDELLGNAVAALVGPNGWYSVGHSNTFLIDGS